MTVTNQNYIHEEIKSKLIQGMLATIHFRMFYLSISCLKT